MVMHMKQVAMKQKTPPTPSGGGGTSAETLHVAFKNN